MTRRLLQPTLLLLFALLASSCMTVRELSSLGAPSLPETTSGDQVSHFICWNVRKGSDERFTDDVRELLADVPDEDNVILCLQEVRSSTYDMIKGLQRKQVSGHYAPSWRMPFSKKSTGVLTIANQPLPSDGAFPIHSPRRELYVASPKVSLSTETPLDDGRTLQIINCHGLNFVPLSVLPIQLDEIFGSLSDDGSPAIVCGDFNAWTRERLDLLNEKAKQAGLAEAEVDGPEHSAAPKWIRGLRHISPFDPDLRLDRIYTRGIEVLDCRHQDGTSSSDHAPLVLRYKVLPGS